MLQRFTPPAHRNVVFSIKQAGVPLGGVVAGLAMPRLVEAWGWRIALIAAAAALAAMTAATLPLRSRIDPPRDAMAVSRLVSFRWTDVIVPLRALSHAPGLWRMSWVGCLLAWPQAFWVTFAATYLVVALGLSLSAAGLVFAVMQAASVVGRVLVGWIADHAVSSTMTLALASVASALSSVAFGLATPDWPLWALLRSPPPAASRCPAGTASRSPRWRGVRRPGWSARPRPAPSSWSTRATCWGRCASRRSSR